MLNITKGNPVPLKAILTVDDEPFGVVNATDISCSLQAMFGTFACEWQHGEEDNELYVDGAATLPSGVYGLEVKGKLNGIPWRTFTQCVVKVTYATEQGDNSPVVPSADIYDVMMEVQLYKSASSDEKIAEHNADEAAHPHIQGLLENKVDKEAGKGLSTNDYTDEDQSKVAALPQVEFVTTLPDAHPSAANVNKLYVVVEANPSGVTFDDYKIYKLIVIGRPPHFTYAWQRVGGVTSLEMLVILDRYVTQTMLDDALATKQDAEQGKGLSTNDYTDEDKTKLSGLSNYDDTQVRQMIADTNAHFADYYTKAESYSATEVDTLLRTQRQGQYVVAATLPTPSEETMFKIYLVPSQDAEQGNVKDEYVTLQDGGTYAWEKIGSTSVDLSGYSTTDEMNAAITSALTSYYTKTQTDTLLSGKQDKVQKVSIEFYNDLREAHEVKFLTPNTIAEVTFVDYIDFGIAPPVTGYKTEYCFTFDVNSTIPTLTLPSDIVWAEELTLEANTHYVILISYENGGYYGDWKSYPITVEP